MTFLDKTFCASPNCENKCGRKMTKEEKTILYKMRVKIPDLPIAYGLFCSNVEEISIDEAVHKITDSL